MLRTGADRGWRARLSLQPNTHLDVKQDEQLGEQLCVCYGGLTLNMLCTNAKCKVRLVYTVWFVKAKT